MTENLPPKYIGYVIIILLIVAVGAAVLFNIDKSGVGKKMLMSVLFAIPGMSKTIAAIGGLS